MKQRGQIRILTNNTQKRRIKLYSQRNNVLIFLQLDLKLYASAGRITGLIISTMVYKLFGTR